MCEPEDGGYVLGGGYGRVICGFEVVKDVEELNI